MSNYTQHPALFTFGQGGHQIYYRGDHRSILSGYDRPDDPNVAKDLPDGVTVINKRDILDNDDAIHLLISGPMVNVSLDDGTVSYLDRATAGTTPGPLDQVSVPEYVKLWREVGAAIGIVQGGRIVWE